MPGLSKREKRLQKKALEPPPPPVIKKKPPPRPRFLWLPSLIQSARALLGLPLTSYVAIFLLQLKAGMWWYKDLTSGDTTQYLTSFDARGLQAFL